MTGPTAVASPKNKRERDKDPSSDDDKGGLFYVDRDGDRVKGAVLFPQLATPEKYRSEGKEIKNPVIKANREEAVIKRIKFEEDSFITSREGQHLVTDQASSVFLREGLVAKQIACRKEAESAKVAEEVATFARESLKELQARPIVDHKVVRQALEQRSNLLTANGKEVASRIKLHRAALDLEKYDHELNEKVFKGKRPGSIHREDYRRREKTRASLGFVFANLAGSYQRSEENNLTLINTDRFLVKHGVEALCVHCGTDLSLQSLLGSYVDIKDNDAGAAPKSDETTLNTVDEGQSSINQAGAQSSVESGGDAKEGTGSSEAQVSSVVLELE
jgi:hypothetical protein